MKCSLIGGHQDALVEGCAGAVGRKGFAERRTSAKLRAVWLAEALCNLLDIAAETIRIKT